MGSLYQLMFPNGKRYIGITTQAVCVRFAAHCRKPVKGGGYLVQRAIKKYGCDTVQVSVLAEAEDRELLTLAEVEAISLYGSRHPDGYNMTTGGEGAAGITEETREVRREQMLGNKRAVGNQPWLGKVRSQETRDKIRATLTGRPNLAAKGRTRPDTAEMMRSGRNPVHRPDVKAKLSVAAIAQWGQDPDWRARQAEQTRSLWEDPEYRAKVVAAHTGKRASEETRAKMRAAAARRKLAGK